MILEKIVIGTWALGGSNNIGNSPLGWEEISKSEALQILEYCYTRGIRTFDSSDMYGRGLSEKLLGELHSIGYSDTKIITKGGIIPEFIKGTTRLVKRFDNCHLDNAISMSLDRLKVDTIDGYLLHGINSRDVNEDVIETLNKFKNKGLTKNIGVSISGSERDVPSLIKNDNLDYVEIPYTLNNPSNVSLLDGLFGHKNTTFLLRSIFLHGLLLLPKNHNFHPNDHRQTKINKTLSKQIEVFSKEISKLSLRTIEAVIIVCLGTPENCKILYGAKSLSQTKEFITLVTHCSNNYSSELRNTILEISKDIFKY